MKHDFSEETVKKKRTFPTANTCLLIFLMALQIGCLLFGIFYTPTPQDRIESYTVTVTPLEDGSLDITYDIVWCALDASEPLTWVTVGMANPQFTVYKNSVSDTIKGYERDYDGNHSGLRLDLTDSYSGGETVFLSFKINQEYMLCRRADGYFYEFIPGWFNRVPVDRYEFKWKADERVTAVNTERQGAYYVWSGQLDCGEYQAMRVSYEQEAFDGCPSATYRPFRDDGAYNELMNDKAGAWTFALAVILVALVGEIYILDSYVSYRKGRGFLSGYGHPVHTYGRTNPVYIRVRTRHTSSSRGGRGGRGGGCACACACACAGGGRAGCSQKDTYGSRQKQESDQTK